MNTIGKLGGCVNPVHFEDFDGKQFERLVYAYHVREGKFQGLEWYGQCGKDGGRDILGVELADEGKSARTVCILCANWKKLTLKKITGDIDKVLKSPSGRPGIIRVVCGHDVLADVRDKAKGYAKKKAIKACEVWSGKEFEEHLRATPRGDSLLRRFVHGEDFPDAPDQLAAFASAIPAAEPGAYVLARGLAENLGKLADIAAKYSHQPRQIAIYGAQHFAEAFLCGMDIGWMVGEAISDAARRVYSPSDPQIYVGRAGPYRSCIGAVDDLFIFCRNMLYRGRRCPLEPDVMELAKVAQAERTSSQSGSSADYKLRYEKARMDLWRRLGLRTWDDVRELLAKEWETYDSEALPSEKLCALAERAQLREFAIKLEREGLVVARVVEGGK